MSEAFETLLDLLLRCNPSEYCLNVQAELLGGLGQVVLSIEGDDNDLELSGVALPWHLLCG